MQNMIFVLYPLFCILLPCMLYVLIQTKGFHRRTNFIHMIWVFIFLYYVYLVLETTGIGTIWEIGLYPGMKLQEEINLIPFRDGISLSMILNVVMFMPLGFLLPLLWKEYQSHHRKYPRPHSPDLRICAIPFLPQRLFPLPRLPVKSAHFPPQAQ